MDAYITLSDVFAKQQELIELVKPTELANGVARPDFPLDLTTHQGQMVLREFMGWFVEELIEFQSATNHNDRCEELSDCYHFLVEIYLMLGMDESDLPYGFVQLPLLPQSPISVWPTINAVWPTINAVLVVGQLLKLKPWKRTAPPVDISTIKLRMQQAAYAFSFLINNMGLTLDDLNELYMDKHRVNVQRQESGY